MVNRVTVVTLLQPRFPIKQGPSIRKYIIVVRERTRKMLNSYSLIKYASCIQRPPPPHESAASNNAVYSCVSTL